MRERDPRVDAYVERSAEFARPILEHLRALVHDTCPEVEETIKWGFPHFVHAGSVLCSMAAFKQHAAFGFWKGALIDGVGAAGDDKSAMGQFGRLQTIADLPPRRTLQALLRKAMKLNEEGIKPPARTRKPGPATPLPSELAVALARNARARRSYEGFPPGEQREYREWVGEAKRPETRERRAAQAAEWLAAGRKRNWKYVPKRP
jgi:uncharacterized protein YdeI (YjbR/CyaY-like superfamily)